VSNTAILPGYVSSAAHTLHAHRDRRAISLGMMGAAAADTSDQLDPTKRVSERVRLFAVHMLVTCHTLPSFSGSIIARQTTVRHVGATRLLRTKRPTGKQPDQRFQKVCCREDISGWRGTIGALIDPNGPGRRRGSAAFAGPISMRSCSKSRLRVNAFRSRYTRLSTIPRTEGLQRTRHPPRGSQRRSKPSMSSRELY
jgi:hypothetical protein